MAKVNALMRNRVLKILADFESIGASEVEAHLTDLVVDGDVAISTQNQAFSGLLFARWFFRLRAKAYSQKPKAPLGKPAGFVGRPAIVSCGTSATTRNR